MDDDLGVPDDFFDSPALWVDHSSQTANRTPEAELEQLPTSFLDPRLALLGYALESSEALLPPVSFSSFMIYLCILPHVCD